MSFSQIAQHWILPPLLVLSTIATSGAEPQDANEARPNVLLIVSEDNGPELSCYGDKNVRTLHLDELASQGVRFEHAFVTHPVCSCSRSSILTGLYPHRNGQIGLATHKYAMFRDFPNIPSVLRQHGYRTGIIGKLHVNPESAFPFDFHWNDRQFISFGHRDVRRIAQKADKFIAASDEPFFLMVNYPDAHFPLLRQQNGIPQQPLTASDVEPLPFIGVDSPRLRQGAADYYNCLKRLDAGIGMLLDRLEKSGKANNTLVIYIGDHGAQFSRGKATCYEGGLRIPFIVRWPGKIKAGLVRNELISTIDILPTIIEAVGVSELPHLPGRSLLPLARGEDAEWRDYLFAERTAYSASTFYPQRTVRDSRYKLIVNLLHDRPNPVYDNYLHQRGSFFMYGTNPEELASASEAVQRGYETWHNPPPVELYDLQAGPHEFVNLAGRPKFKKVQERLLAALSDWQRRTHDSVADKAKLARLTAEHVEVHKKYPDQGYRRDPKFRWRYLDYLSPSPRQEPVESR